MSGETEERPSGWSVDTLRQHLSEMAAERDKRLDQRIDYEAKLAEERDKRYEQRFLAQESATAYMRQVTNEFRGQLADQQSTFITRTETLARAQSNADKIDALATRIDRTEGRSTGLNAGWGWLIGAVGLIGALISIFITLSK